MKELEKFGELYMKHVRDICLWSSKTILQGKFNIPEYKAFFEEFQMQKFTEQQLELINLLVYDAVDNAMHHTLFFFEQYCDETDIYVNSEDGKLVGLGAESDGLAGELYTEDGWIKKYSKHPGSLELFESRYGQNTNDENSDQ